MNEAKKSGRSSELPYIVSEGSNSVTVGTFAVEYNYDGERWAAWIGLNSRNDAQQMRDAFNGAFLKGETYGILSTNGRANDSLADAARYALEILQAQARGEDVSAERIAAAIVRFDAVSHLLAREDA